MKSGNVMPTTAVIDCSGCMSTSAATSSTSTSHNENNNPSCITEKLTPSSRRPWSTNFRWSRWKRWWHSSRNNTRSNGEDTRRLSQLSSQLPPPSVSANLCQQSFTRQLAFGQLNGNVKSPDFYNNQALSLAAKILSLVIILATLVLIMISTRPRE